MQVRLRGIRQRGAGCVAIDRWQRRQHARDVQHAFTRVTGISRERIEQPVEIGRRRCQRARQRSPGRGEEVGAVPLLQHTLIVERRQRNGPTLTVVSRDREIAIGDGAIRV